ncbi:MAG: hypothetical protein EBR30_27115, partial [Cytophagia bacterium]|nr:hypothetical protein [Cytophagia bacterium]
MRNLPGLLFLFICNLTYGQNTYPTNGPTVLNSGENQSLIIRDGRSGINWNYLEWQFSNGTRDWVLGRRYANGNFTLWREGLNEVLTVNNLGNVGIGTVSPYSKLNIMDNGISINASDQFNGGLIIQSNTGGRSQTLGAQLEFVIPANTDGSNMWAQARIITVAGNSATGSASGKMILGTRRYWQKPGTSNHAWYYGDDITIDQSGLVGIGTINPTEKLTVNGNVYSKEVKVDVNAGTG